MTRFSSSFIHNYKNNILKTYGPYCPIFSRFSGTVTEANSKEEGKFIHLSKYLVE